MSLLNKVTVAATATVMLFGTGIASGSAVSAAPATSQGDTGETSSLGGTQISTESEEAGPAQMAAAAAEHAQLLGNATGEVKCVIKDNGCYQAFAQGALFFSPVTGAEPVVDKMWQQYRANGFENGSWGYPLDAPVTNEDGSVTQRFQGGVKEVAAPAPEPAPQPESETQPAPGGNTDNGQEQSPEPSPEASQEPSEAPSTQAPEPAPSTQAPQPAPKPSPKPESKKPAPKPKPKPKPKKKDSKPKKSKKVSEDQLRKNIIKEARKGIGTRYVWGGTSPTKGWDCSGFTQYVYKKNGINIPRVSGAQRSAGKVVKASEAKPGDIIWVPGHVGIVSDKKGKMIDAGSRRTGTSERSYAWMVKRGAKFIRYI